MINWQPIETAPKDATQILLIRCNEAIVSWWGRKAWTNLQGWVNWPMAESPTHWAPINLPGNEVSIVNACDGCKRDESSYCKSCIRGSNWEATA